MCNGAFTYTETGTEPFPRDRDLSQKWLQWPFGDRDQSLWLIHIHGDLSRGRGPVPEKGTVAN